MKIAVISDIHGNARALQAVLRDIAQQSLDQVYCAGDLVGYGPAPNEVIELIRERRIPTVMGNYDDGIGYLRFVCGCDYKDEKAQALGQASIAWTKQYTTEENKEFLRQLPSEIRFRVGGQRVLLVHGSPQRLNEYLFEDISVEYATELMSAAEADILVCGHTHKPYYRRFGDRHLINVGSVGKPKHGAPEATYAVIDFGAELNVSIRKVEYDFEEVARAIEESGLPDEFARMLRTGSS